MRRLGWASVWMAVVVAATACDLTDVAIVDFTDIVVAEVYVTVADTPGENTAFAFIHGTTPGSPPSSQSYDDALVTVTDGAGVQHELVLTLRDRCVSSLPSTAAGSCFAASPLQASRFGAGDPLALEIVLSDGRRLTGTTRIPGDFTVAGVGGLCRIAPDTLLPLHWSPSDSAWAYVSEALISGLTDALAPEGIEAPDSLSLTGLSISESDTTVVFPSEFGIFDRFDLDHDLAVRLQTGLPEGASSQVAITAVDRNHVNWVRGGSFNPSGTVRVSSLVGDGSGVFSSAVARRFLVVSTTDTTVAPDCPAG